MTFKYLGLYVYGVPRVKVATLVMGEEVGPAGLVGVVRLPMMKVGNRTYPFAYLMTDDGPSLPRLEAWAKRRGVEIERLGSDAVRLEFQRWLKGREAKELLAKMADERSE